MYRERLLSRHGLSISVSTCVCSTDPWNARQQSASAPVLRNADEPRLRATRGITVLWVLGMGVGDQ